MKVLITSDCYKPTINGVVTSIINLKTGLEAMGAEVRVLTLSSSKHSYSEDGVYYIGSLDIGRLYPGVRLRTRSGRREVEDILDWKPDIIHTQSEFSTFTLARKIGKKLSIPLVHTYHTVYEDYTHYFSPQEKIGKKAVSALTNHVGNRVSAMIAPTKKVEGILRRYGVSCPVSIIPSGISLDKFQKKVSEEHIRSIKDTLNIPQDHYVLVSVSRVCKEKNIEELIQFMKEIREDKFTLVIVGDGPAREELQAMTVDLGLQNSIRFTGMVAPETVPAYYQMADLFVSASTSETQGLTYIEALASGTPILCREDDSLFNVLIEGQNGFAYTNEAEFYRYLNVIKSADMYGDMSSFAEESAQAYAQPTFAKRVYDLYRELIRGKGENMLEEEKDRADRSLFNALTAVLMVLLLALSFYGYQQGYFTSINDLQTMISSVGIWAPIVFILLQVLQVVFPIIPGGLGTLAGVILFGPLWGFIYNYIGIVAGSLIVFGISKVYGKKLVLKLFPRVMTDRYFKWVDKKERFKKWFAAAIFFPMAPDDLLCYIAGTTKMKWKEYIAIIVLGKPASIAIYSMGLNTAFQYILPA